jgi:hypothetical protein
LPHLFSPVEIRRPQSTSLIYWSKNNMNKICNVNRLYFSKGDIDLDRPTVDGA